ncbi:uncharacterized protein A1O5_06830 [Cladophialophora psammophila CBS 110553]|uniref:Uncharacterized protein n=1 Tax=Cladophialophora psammophila CBS 110553 TaxID=1182543 RepID=W9XHB8_9EURO|nr:uncharacterized protein A1O5_06830 [Cladophialophora psammophila CBS 110553]EXJ69759.1 hypothetical protein A1O5_06830 [Cladophialophora psammophila CBS 110553]
MPTKGHVSTSGHGIEPPVAHAPPPAAHAPPPAEHPIAAPTPKPPIPPPNGPGFVFPPEGHDAPAPGELFWGGGGRRDPLANERPTGRTPPPSSVFGNLQPHSGGPGQAGYPFFGSGLADVPGVKLTPAQKAMLARPPPALGTGPAVEPPGGHPEIRGPAGDFHGAPTRSFNPEEPLQPPVHNQFDTLRDEDGRDSVNNALRHASGPLQVGSSGFGASTGQLPIRTTDGFHTSVDPRGEHATFEVDPNINPDGTTHLYPGGASSSVAPRLPGETGNRPLHDFPNQQGAPPPVVPGLPHPFPLQQVQETNPTGRGSFYPDPDLAAAAAAGPGGADPGDAGAGGPGGAGTQ